jgi:hypothetical protein
MSRERDTYLSDPPPLCRISYWQGYVTGRYHAHDGAGKTFLCSASFRTWKWRHGNAAAQERDAARAALEDLVRRLGALGWRIAERDPEPINRDTVLSALGRIGAGEGATAAEVGREVLGEEAPLVQHLPLRVGAELRRLQLQGKVERHQNGGPPRWFLTGFRYPESE